MDTGVRKDRPAKGLAANGAVVVEYEEPKFELGGYEVPATWPLRLLTWFYMLGVAGGVVNLVVISILGAGLGDPKVNIPREFVPRVMVGVVLATISSGVIAWLLHRRRRYGAIAGLLGLSIPFARSLYLGHAHIPSALAVAVGALAVVLSWRELD